MQITNEKANEIINLIWFNDRDLAIDIIEKLIDKYDLYFSCKVLIKAQEFIKENNIFLEKTNQLLMDKKKLNNNN